MEINNPVLESVWINLTDQEGNGVFDTSSIEVLPGIGVYTVFFYPLNGFMGGLTTITYTAVERHVNCSTAFEIDFEACNNGGKPAPVATGNGFAENSSGLMLAPNPTAAISNAFYTFAQVSGEKSIVVMDMLGKILINLRLQEATGTLALDFSRYAAGHYMVLLKQDGRLVAQRKLIVNQP